MKNLQSHDYYMELALAQAENALRDGEFPVGCVMVEDGEVVSSGKRASSGLEPNEIDHAEILALRDLVAERKNGDLGKVIVYSTMEPCLMCFSTMIVNGIRTMVYGYEDVMGGGTNINLLQLKPLYVAMEISIIPHVLRERSLLLFKEFFADSQNQYWHDSLLAQYTMKQKLKGRQ